jgi:mono/diheme cytochrome c family protein
MADSLLPNAVSERALAARALSVSQQHRRLVPCRSLTDGLKLAACALIWAALALSSLQAQEENTAQADLAAQKEAAFQASQQQYRQVVVPFFARHCNDCHGAQDPEGELHLARLDPNLESTSAARWAMVLDQLVSGEMPPEGEDRPSSKSVTEVVDWIKAEMKRSGKHLARREAYANGNKVSHHLLFDPKQQAPLDVPPRIRTVSPEIYEEFTRDLAKGYENLVGQPFSPSGKTTFKDMQLARVDEPVTASLIRNALVIAERQTGFRMEKGEMKPMPGARKEFLPFVDEQQPLGEPEMEKAVRMQFARVLNREPDEDELARFMALMKKNVAEAGRLVGVRYTLAAVFLLPEAVFRYELGGDEIDAQGRVRLTPGEVAFALSYALTDERPKSWLLDAAEKGDLDTKQGVAAAVRKMLADPKLKKPRILRFFREYFEYDKATEVFKDTSEMKAHDPRVLVEDTDRLIEYILEQDKQVLRELLTTNKAFVFHRGAEDLKKKRAEALAKFEREKKKNPEKYEDKEPRLPGRSIYESYSLDDFPDEQPVSLPKNQRAGILTQPSWLVAWSTSDDNHAILRGKWVRERLLGGVVPDIPITVDAQLPDAPDQTLRQRMAVTRQEYCWQCHQLMNRVGLPLEMYDHFGRYRETEPVLDPEATARNVDKKGKPLGDVMKHIPVDASGGFEFTLDANLKGDVRDAIEFLHKMADSEVVEQVFVRHAFRYWMGRNETLGDAKSLQAAHRAYRESDGSMKELIAALLSSESFLYRVRSEGPKSEIRISKSETNSNIENTNDRNAGRQALRP